MFVGSLELAHVDFSKELAQLMDEKCWPKKLQDEMYDEWVGREASQYSMHFVRSHDLVSLTPVEVSLQTLLEKEENLESIARTPIDVIEHINEHWGVSVTPEQQYKRRPERYFEYASLPGETANPSVMIGGEIFMGVGRYVAALLRGDNTMKVWMLKEEQ